MILSLKQRQKIAAFGSSYKGMLAFAGNAQAQKTRPKPGFSSRDHCIHGGGGGSSGLPFGASSAARMACLR
ncbi:hypothetical protein, partial [Pseudomonas sp. Sample_9]|uniref:hypothetical protein n=1 Tax=Pseudomonas sp. Sample_9 TaxID=2382158 RepID=UPI0019D6285E